LVCLSSTIGQSERLRGDAVLGEKAEEYIGLLLSTVADIYDELVLTANIEHFDALGVDIESY
jgi:hypothetical protein